MTMESSFILEVMEIRVATLPEFLKEDLESSMTAREGQGAGEIVVKRSYFETHLSKHFEYPRNFQASLIKEKELDQFAEKAIADKAALFVPFIQLPEWLGGIREFIDNFESIVNELESGVDFDIDGVVFELVNQELKTHMGSNRKFSSLANRFQRKQRKSPSRSYLSYCTSRKDRKDYASC